jgi:hypothetical protein
MPPEKYLEELAGLLDCGQRWFVMRAARQIRKLARLPQRFRREAWPQLAELERKAEQVLLGTTGQKGTGTAKGPGVPRKGTGREQRKGPARVRPSGRRPLWFLPGQGGAADGT